MSNVYCIVNLFIDGNLIFSRTTLLRYLFVGYIISKVLINTTCNIDM